MYITSGNMYRMEKESNIEPSILMNHAAAKIYEELLKIVHLDAKVFVIAGTGNNGGDAICVAHLLKNDHFQVQLCLTEEPKSPLAIEKLADFCRQYEDAYTIYQQKQSFEADFIVEGIFGIGFRGTPNELYQEIFTKINHSPACKISIDIPSGISSNDAFFSTAVKADYTFTIQCPKLSSGLKPSKDYYGDTRVLDIGIPITSSSLSIVNQIQLPKRLPTSHKGDHGKGLLIAGSEHMPGAATIASLAAIKSGLGLLSVATAPKVQAVIASHVVEAMYFDVKADDAGYLADVASLDFDYPDVIAMGCGLGRANHDYLNPLLNVKKPIIIDADGLYHLAGNISWLERRASETVILTPHEMEMARLTQKPLEDIQQNRFQVSYDFATKYGVYVILKGANTLITTPNGEQYVNTTGNESLAKGGTGDMLTGMLLGLVPQHKNTIDALVNAVYLHGLTGNLYTKKYRNSYTATVTDFMKLLPKAFAKTTR